MFDRLFLFLRHVFGFTKTESGGFMILFILLLGVLAAPAIYQKFQQVPYRPVSQNNRQLDSLVVLIEERLNPPPEQLNPFPFDPNTISLEEFDQMNFPLSLAETIINYREKGGKFRIKKDLQKIYSMSDTLYLALENYIDLPEKYERKKPQTSYAYKKKETTAPVQPVKVNYSPPAVKSVEPLDLNTADSLSLQMVNGIGPTLSSRIVKYRNRLGGFVRMDQLSEVYGLQPEVIKRLGNDFFISEGFSPQRIDLQQIDFKTLLKHPYISYKQAKLLKAYIEQHKGIQSKEELYKIPLIDSLLVEKLSPYLKIN